MRKAIFLSYKPKHEQDYTNDWLTKWVRKRKFTIVTFSFAIKVLKPKGSPQNFWNKRAIFYAKYCNKPVKNYDFAPQQHNLTGSENVSKRCFIFDWEQNKKKV